MTLASICQKPPSTFDSAVPMTTATAVPSLGAVQMTPPSASVPVLFLMSPGRWATSVTPTDCVGSTPSFSAVAAHGAAPMVALSVGSLKASMPPTNCRVASRVVLTVRPSMVRLSSGFSNGPLGPLICRMAVVASAGDSNA